MRLPLMHHIGRILTALLVLAVFSAIIWFPVQHGVGGKASDAAVRIIAWGTLTTIDTARSLIETVKS